MAPSEHFTGSARVDPLFQSDDPGRTTGAYVVFEPEARTDWHAHALGQTLIVTEGLGRIQRWGGPVQEVRPGDVAQIPPGVKHWHGASPDVAMTHLAIGERLAGTPAEWMEKVGDDQYAPASADTSGDETPSRAQQLMGDIAPRLADLTDDVLYGQVWSSPELSPRDRSLVTVGALIGMNRPDQLRSHLAIARRNGATEAELIEAITHLAFYAGWPSAVTAIQVAREVFQED
jgi:4-carboxymuconolactone decarboxylase